MKDLASTIVLLVAFVSLGVGCTSYGSSRTEDECEIDLDCAGCTSCVLVNGFNACEDLSEHECVLQADCGEGEYCDPYRPDMSDCGGVCRDLNASYVLHEWGVNTPRVDGTASVHGGPTRYNGSMDRKPVMYVYAVRPITIDVSVSFASGSSTETWPELPNGPTILWENVEVNQGGCYLTPTPEPDRPEDIEDKEIYQLSEWVVPGADCLVHGDTVSKLLFYTGEMDDYEPPISARAVIDLDPADGHARITFELTNTGPALVGPLLLLHRETPGDCLEPYSCPVTEASLAFGSVPSLEPGETNTVTLSIQHLVAGEEGGDVAIPPGWAGMADDLEQMLAEIGLYTEEIEVFMNTWRDLFFGLQVEGDLLAQPDYENGPFVIYPWPESHAEQNVPLTLNPPPVELSRAIVEYQKVLPWQARTGEVFGKVMLEEYMGDEPPYTTPAAGATVAAWQDGVLIKETLTGEEGGYSLVLDEGMYDITAERYEEWELGDRVEGVEVQAGLEVEVNLTLYSNDMVDKPNIYLYPTERTEVDVRLGLSHGCRVTHSEPEYGDGWHVSVAPDGLIDGRYTYLFYEAEIPRRYAMSSGWSVAAAEVSTFFTQALDAYGLTRAERDDFVNYWSEHLAPAPYYSVYPLMDDAVLDPMVALYIDPAPDTVFRLWFVIASDEGPQSLPEPDITPVVREGFTVVEWGVILR